MAIVYLQPSDLSATQAAQVLDFLNTASSARQLARDIEFPHEPDIGVRLGQRLLDARAALGGRFTDLSQVRAVRLIGPERFTEICVAALGLDPARWVELFFCGTPFATPTDTGLVLSLTVHPERGWLGKPRTVRLQVNDHGGTPRAGAAVTVHSNIGRLVYAYGFQRIEGQAVTVLTGSDGSAKLELLTPPSEPLTDNQQAALEVALAALDPAAPHPLALAAELRAMADAYLRDRSYSLRSAVDLHVRDAYGASIDALDHARWKLAWPVDSGLLQADVIESESHGCSIARAVRTTTWINWVKPWVNFLGEALDEDELSLEQELADRAREGKGELLDELIYLAQARLAGHSGQSAQWLGKRQVNAAVDRFLGSGIKSLPVELQQEIVSQLDAAVAGVSSRSLGSYALGIATRDKLVKNLDTELADRLALSQQFDRLEEKVNERIGEASALARAVQQDRLAIDAQVASFNQNLAVFDQNRTVLDQRISTIDADLKEVINLNDLRFRRP